MKMFTYGSIVASSISITGISSLIGYTRWHWSHLSAAPFLTSLTGVLQCGHARISRSSASTGIGGLRLCAGRPPHYNIGVEFLYRYGFTNTRRGRLSTCAVDGGRRRRAVDRCLLRVPHGAEARGP